AKLVYTAQKLASLGLNKGASGNCSVRNAGGFLITPSGIDTEVMTAESVVAMQMNGDAEANKKPSSEWRFHRDIYQHHPEVNAVIHTHSMFATTIACLHQDVPPFHYMIAMAGGDSIRCAPYALFGTQALSNAALTALKNRKACLLANHGMIAMGTTLEAASALAVEVENLCEQYWRLLQMTAAPLLLSDTEMQAVFEQFKGYQD
ncbi:MAG: L-fuculose-phosphate aldolase, partial [Methylophilaceae bacterium]